MTLALAIFFTAMFVFGSCLRWAEDRNPDPDDPFPNHSTVFFVGLLMVVMWAAYLVQR